MKKMNATLIKTPVVTDMNREGEKERVNPSKTY
jgi:hypothetical protein